jgi:membrane carboxypeptidase/penicillin-binding protein PbpC
VTPYAVIAVSDRDQQSVPQARLVGNARPQVISPQIAYLTSDILADPVARSRAFGMLSALIVDRPAAVKTGTTTGWRDSWTVGFSPDRIVGVWVGNADGTPMEGVMGLDGAAPVWHDVMVAAHRDMPPRPFPRPPGIVEVEICAEGGLRPSPVCPTTRQELFIAGSEPTRPDDTHLLIAVAMAGTCRLQQAITPVEVPMSLFRLLPAEAETWAIRAGLPRPPTRICGAAGVAEPQPVSCLGGPGCLTVLPVLVSPAPDTRFAIDPGVPQDRQRLELVAQADPASNLTFFVDHAPVAQLRGSPYITWWQLRPGIHRAYVEVVTTSGAIMHSPEVTFSVLP